MDRKQQLRNVSFGGAWSEQIAGREEQAAAIAQIADAAQASARRDPLARDTLDAVDLLCNRHPKGPMLRDSWLRAARIEVPGRRVHELARIADLIAAAYAGLKT